MDRIVRYIITGDTEGGIRAMRKLESASENTTKKLSKTGHEMEKVGRSTKKLGGHVSALAGIIGAGGLAFGIKDIVQAGMGWQTQQAQLRSSLQATGLAGAALTAKIKAVNDEVERSSTRGGFAPSVETGGIAKLVTSTHSATKALKLNTEVIAVARRAGLDYASAYSLVARAQTGQARGLAKYIGIVQPVTRHVQALRLAHAQLNPQMLRHAQLLDKQATANMVNARIMRRLGGATSAYSHTAQGAISNASNGFAAMKEQLGRDFLPMVTKVGMAMASVARWMERHKTLATILIATFGGLTITLIALAGAIAAVDTVTTAWAGIQKILDIELSANPIGAVILAIAALIAVVVLVAMHFNRFKAIARSVFSWLEGAVGSVVGFVKKHWPLLLAIMGGPFTLLPYLVVTHFGKVKKFVGGVIGWIGDKFDWLWRKIKGVINAIGNLPKNALHFAGNVLHTATFGLFNQGGLIPRMASGGMVRGPGGIDRVPIMATAGEFMLRKEVVSSVGVANLNALNSSGQLARGGMPDTIELHHTTKIGARVLTQEVVKFQLQMAARA